jgi:SP family xylose:H+ symportor-like MFS transporter
VEAIMKHAVVSTSHLQAIVGTTFVSALGWLMSGYCHLSISGLVGAIDHNYIAPRALHPVMANLLLGVTVCATLGGTIVGAMVARRAADRFGRRRTLTGAAVLFVVSALGSAFPESGLAPGSLGPDALWPFIFYRVLGGMGASIAAAVAPLHVSEFAPTAVRGQLASYQQIAIGGGICMALLVNWGIAVQGDDAWLLRTGWRFMMVSLAVPALAFLWLSLTLPESPRWLISRGRHAEARKVLSRSADSREVDRMIEELSAPGVVVPRTPVLSFGLKVVMLGITLNLLQQLIGLTAISYFGPTILERLGYHSDSAMLGALIARALNLLATIAVVLLVDRVGRKPLLIAGALIMGPALVVLGWCLQTGEHAALGLAAMCCYLIGLGISFGPIVWVLLAEMFPAPVRAEASELAVKSQWAANGLVAVTFPVLFVATDPSLPFFIYAGFAVLAVIVVARCVPETAGVRNESMSRYWRARAAREPT